MLKVTPTMTHSIVLSGIPLPQWVQSAISKRFEETKGSRFCILVIEQAILFIADHDKEVHAIIKDNDPGEKMSDYLEQRIKAVVKS